MSRLSNTKARIAALLLLVTSTLAAGAGSLALLTDQATVTWTHDVQTIALTVNDAKTVTLPATHWQNPGSKVYVPLFVKAAGTGELKYGITSTTLGNADLGSNGALVVNMKANTAPDNCNAAGWSSAGAIIISDSSPESADMPLATAGRTLSPGWVERVCIQVQYNPGTTTPSTAPMDWTLTFNAESTYTG